MVFFFDVGDNTATGRAGYIVYMGENSDENDVLIEWGWRSDIWFHVDGLSSAHVYLRLPVDQALCGCAGRCGCLLEKIDEEVIGEMCQLVKANSISGVKAHSVSVVYTPHSNLNKQESMKSGSVGFHTSAHRRLRLTEKDKALVKALEKTRRDAPGYDFQREKTGFERQCMDVLKKIAREQRELAAAADPYKAAKNAKKEREDFLSSGGYHGTAIAATEKRAEEKAAKEIERAFLAQISWQGDGGLSGEMDTMVIGGDDDGQVAELDDEAEEGAAAALSHAEEAALRAAEADVDVAWLRERGYEAATASAALAGAAPGAGTLKRRLSALAALQEARGVGEEGDDDSETAAEGRAEEQEALEAILGDDIVIYYPDGEGTDWDGDSGLGVPVQGFEPPEGGELPPLGAALPLLAVTGGGLLESELRALTDSLVAHATENIELGPVVFELTSHADEKAAELAEAKEERATAIKARADAKARAEKQALKPKKKPEPKKPAAAAAAGAGRLAAGAPAFSPGVAAFTPGGGDGAPMTPRESPAAGGGGADKAVFKDREDKRIDAQSRLGKFAEGKVASTFVSVNEAPTDVLGGGGVDKSGFVSKKKKKKK